MIYIGRVHQSKDSCINVYIGRGSPLGNPWPINAKQSRDDVCDRYDTYLRKAVKDKESAQYKEMVRLYLILKSGVSINLQCFCTPSRCHGETIKAILESALAKS